MVRDGAAIAISELSPRHRFTAGVSVPALAACGVLGNAAVAEAATWAIVPSPAQGILTAVSCAAATRCTAVGFQQINGPDASLAERWDGRRWSSQPIPKPAGTVPAY